MLRLADSWIWDFWFADDGRAYHVFFLQAPRTLGDPELRHVNVAVGHATSEDLIHWTEAPDALAPAASPAFDDLATWTGSVVRGPDGTWFMFYTGGTDTGHGVKQRIGLATSADLYSWRGIRPRRCSSATPAGTSCSARAGTRRGGTRGCSPIPAETAGTCW